METTNIRKGMAVSALVDRRIVGPAISASFVKLDPRTLMKNPVMFVLEVVTALTTIILIRDLFTGGAHLLFEFQIVIWLWASAGLSDLTLRDVGVLGLALCLAGRTEQRLVLTG